MIPKMSVYGGIEITNHNKSLKRRARFAPQLLADGLTSGIVSDQANLVHGSFDDGANVDPYVDIHSDKFMLLNSRMESVSVDPALSDNPSGSDSTSD